jgi:hypothetical protein
MVLLVLERVEQELGEGLVWVQSYWLLEHFLWALPSSFEQQ